MKIFIYKTSIVIISIYLLFQFTIGQVLKNYESKVENLLHNKQGREQILAIFVEQPFRKSFVFL